MSYLLDTNTCIQYLNGRSDQIRQKMESSPADEIMLCAVVNAELFYGAFKSAQVERNLVRIRRFAGRFISLPFDAAASEIYGQIRSQLERSGTPIGPNDLLIAAIAVAHKATLVTHNSDEFSRIDDLSIEDWEAPNL